MGIDKYFTPDLLYCSLVILVALFLIYAVYAVFKYVYIRIRCSFTLGVFGALGAFFVSFVVVSFPITPPTLLFIANLYFLGCVLYISGSVIDYKKLVKRNQKKQNSEKVQPPQQEQEPKQRENHNTSTTPQNSYIHSQYMKRVKADLEKPNQYKPVPKKPTPPQSPKPAPPVIKCGVNINNLMKELDQVNFDKLEKDLDSQRVVVEDSEECIIPKNIELEKVENTVPEVESAAQKSEEKVQTNPVKKKVKQEDRVKWYREHWENKSKKERPTMKEVAAELGISVRQVKYDLENLGLRDKDKEKAKYSKK